MVSSFGAEAQEGQLAILISKPGHMAVVQNQDTLVDLPTILADSV